MILSQKQQKSRNSWFVRSVFLLLLGTLLACGALAPAAHAQAPKGNLPPHSATLTSTPQTPSINVYRCPGTCTSSTGTYSLLNPAPLVTTSGTVFSFTDSTVAANTTYTWCETGVSGSLESACSVPVTATIPKDAAAAPTGLAVTTQ